MNPHLSTKIYLPIPRQRVSHVKPGSKGTRLLISENDHKPEIWRERRRMGECGLLVSSIQVSNTTLNHTSRQLMLCLPWLSRMSQAALVNSLLSNGQRNTLSSGAKIYISSTSRSKSVGCQAVSEILRGATHCRFQYFQDIPGH